MSNLSLWVQSPIACGKRKSEISKRLMSHNFRAYLFFAMHTGIALDTVLTLKPTRATGVCWIQSQAPRAAGLPLIGWCMVPLAFSSHIFVFQP